MTTNTSKLTVRVGDVRRIGGMDFVALRRTRGRAGEPRSMWVLGRQRDDGSIVAAETRALATVRDAPLVGRMRLRVSVDGWGCTRGEVDVV